MTSDIRRVFSICCCLLQDMLWMASGVFRKASDVFRSFAILIELTRAYQNSYWHRTFEVHSHSIRYLLPLWEDWCVALEWSAKMLLVGLNLFISAQVHSLPICSLQINNRTSQLIFNIIRKNRQIVWVKMIRRFKLFDTLTSIFCKMYGWDNL